MKEPTLLIIYPNQGDRVYSLIVAETGECLAQHMCSHEGYAMGDLYSRRKERIEEYANRFGEVEVKFQNQTDITFKELLKRNKAFYADQMQQGEPT